MRHPSFLLTAAALWLLPACLLAGPPAYPDATMLVKTDKGEFTINIYYQRDELGCGRAIYLAVEKTYAGGTVQRKQEHVWITGRPPKGVRAAPPRSGDLALKARDVLLVGDQLVVCLKAGSPLGKDPRARPIGTLDPSCKVTWLKDGPALPVKKFNLAQLM